MRDKRILLVDDDTIIRRGLQNTVPWEENGFEVVAVVSDGEKALEVLNREKVHIVVSDIRMPFMDGLDLAERIQNEFPNIRVILLTGYEDFEYARKAIKYQVFDYLMKPVDKEQLLHTVQKAAKEIEENEKVYESLNENILEKQKKFYRNLLQGGIKNDEVTTCMDRLKVALYNTGSSGVISVLPDCCSLHSNENDLSEQVFTKLLGWAEEILKDFFQGYQGIGLEIDLLPVERKQVNYLMTLEIEDSNYMKQCMLSLAQMIRQKIGYDFPFTATVGVGGVEQGIYGLYESHEKAKKALKSRHLYGKDKVIMGENLKEQKETLENIVLPKDQIIEHIRLGLKEEVEKDINGVFEHLKQLEYISLESLKIVATELAILIFRVQTLQVGNTSYLFFLNEIQQKKTLEELKEMLLQLGLETTENRVVACSEQAKIASKALEYMQDNFHKEELSLTEVAKSVNVSATYLSIVLKQETNKNFSDHLLEMKMEKAKELLRNTDEKHYKVAEQVGYSNPQYFSVCFKKYTGYTPTQFREL